MARRQSRKKTSAVNVDFTDVEVRVLLPEGVYDATVEKVTQEENNGKPYLSWEFKTIDDDPKFDKKKLYNNTSLQPQSLWVLAQLLDCLGVERPEGPMDLDLEELIGLEISLHVEHEEYEGKTRAKVVDFMAMADSDADEVETVEDGDGEEGEGEEGGEGGYTEDEINEMDADELADVIEENDLKVRKVKKLATLRAKVLAALEEADLIEDNEAEEAGEGEGEGEELYTEDEINEMSAKELDEIVKEEELEVEKPKRATKGKGLDAYREAVIEALDEAELLEDEE